MSKSNPSKTSDDIEKTIQQLQGPSITSPSSASNALSHLDSALANFSSGYGHESLASKYAYNEGAPRPHRNDLVGTNDRLSKHPVDLATSLGSFRTPATTLHSPAGYGWGLTNGLQHMSALNALTNPYRPYGAARNAKAGLTPKEIENNTKRQNFEKKMDKQRLEHILFSGDQGPLEQVSWLHSAKSNDLCFSLHEAAQQSIKTLKSL